MVRPKSLGCSSSPNSAEPIASRSAADIGRSLVCSAFGDTAFRSDWLLPAASHSKTRCLRKAELSAFQIQDARRHGSGRDDGAWRGDRSLESQPPRKIGTVLAGEQRPKCADCECPNSPCIDARAPL